MRGLRLLAGALCALSLSCITYDFEPVNPYAITVERVELEKVGRIPANVVLVIDKSGSMDLPMNPAVSSCGTCGTSKSNLCDPSSCPTRWSELQSALGAFLPNTGGVSRLGLVTYPSDNVCGAPGTVRIPIPASEDAVQLDMHAKNINSVVQGITSSGVGGTPNTTGGGTPTARALQILLNETAFVANDDRKDVVVLLTDGLPNCNANNPNSWTTDPVACRCTLGNDCSAYPKEGCLDEQGSVSVIQALRSRDVTTVVIGFGAEVTSGPGPDVLRALASAGGYERTCAASTDCATGDSCNGGICSSGMFLPTNGAELATFLREISEPADPCVETLSDAADPKTMQVKVDGVPLSETEWSLDGRTVTVTGPACDKLRNATLTDKVDFEVWALREVPAN